MKKTDNRSKNITMADIAAALGISSVTVSNALAGKKGVSSQVRAAVFMKARELGYIEGISENTERAAVRSHEGDIGIVTMQRYTGSESGLHWQLYRELVTEFKQYDGYAILDIVSAEDELKLQVPRIIENHLVSGLIMLGKPDLRFLNEISGWKMPMVFLDFSVRDFDFASITGDDYYDMYRITSFVISHGHSRICYVSENPEDWNRDEYFGYCRAVTESEIEPSLPCSVSQAVERCRAEADTAVICETLPLAEELIRKLGEESISVPDMVSVACVSDFRTGKHSDMTCVCRDPSQMAHLAAQALRSKISGEGKGVGRVSVGGKLSVGSTVRSLII